MWIWMRTALFHLIMAVPTGGFDQNNPKYRCCCRAMHITTASKLVSFLQLLGMLVHIVYSFTRSASYIFYTLWFLAFVIPIYGSLLYAVFKEQRMYALPYLISEAASIILGVIILIAYILIVALSRKTLIQMARDLTDFNGLDTESNFHTIRGVAIFFCFVGAAGLILQLFFFWTIFRFYRFLRERETSFSFEPEFRMT